MSSTFTDSSGIVRLQGTAGGAVPVSAQTATVTTDPSDFYVAQVFDCGHVTLAYLLVTILALTPDGETFGTGMGDLVVALSFDSVNTPATAGISRDNIAYVTAAQAAILDSDMATVGDVQGKDIPTPRYLTVSVYIQDIDAGTIYAGANNPTAQVRLDLEYV
jgi:hypothetical protein